MKRTVDEVDAGVGQDVYKYLKENVIYTRQ